MDYLLHPKKTPNYRTARSHTDFLCRLKDHLDSKAHFIASIKGTLSNRYDLIETSLLLTRNGSPHSENTQPTPVFAYIFGRQVKTTDF